MILVSADAQFLAYHDAQQTFAKSDPLQHERLYQCDQKNPIDVITHLNYQSFCDVVEVAKAARDYGTYIELNSKKVHLTDEEVAKIRDTGVQFLIDSDAHSVDRVGDTQLVDKLLERVEIPHSQIANIDGKFPHFRFREFKERNL